MFERIQTLLDRLRTSSRSLQLNDSLGLKMPAVQHTGICKGNGALAEIVPASRAGATGVTFRVDDVTPTENALPLATLLENVEMRGGAPVLVLPEQSLPAMAPQGFLTKRDKLDRHQFLNPLMEAVHLAFSEHRPLVLTPDCVWLTIVQGFGHHVHLNAEALRGRIVRHEGKKALEVSAESLEPETWPGLISQFSEQIRDNSDPVLYESLLCDFSTTTPNIRVANEVALMDVYQRYFEYIVACVCGIPTITLEGNPSDWQRIRDRIEVLATFGLEWWTSRLASILDEFVATANGNPDRSFWQAIYKPEKLYFNDLATGWITDLFPYVGRPSARRRNRMLGIERTDWLPPKAKHKANQLGISLKEIPCGLSSAPMKVKFPNHPAVDLNLVGGFLGVLQAEEDLSLAPIISWGVVETDKRIPPPPIVD